MKRILGLVAAGTIAAMPMVQAQAADVQVGVLECNVEGGWGLVLGSKKDMVCTYNPAGDGPKETYTGSITKFGIDIGKTEGATMEWAILAPSKEVPKGALAGDYIGVTAEATASVGVGANVLVGGMEKSFTLQPISVQGQRGLNIAAGVASMSLKQAG